MANTFTSGYTVSEAWAPAVQANIEHELVALEICDMQLAPLLKKGDRVNRPILSRMVAHNYVPGQAVTFQDITDDNEQLIVDKCRDVSFYIDDVHDLQNNYDLIQEESANAAYSLMEDMDGAVLAEANNADYTFDDGSIGGTTGNPITVTKSNVVDVLTFLDAELYNLGARDRSRYVGVVPSKFCATLTQAQVINGFQMADEALKYGMTGLSTETRKRTVGSRGYEGLSLGFGIYKSNNVLHKQTFTHSSNLSNGATISFANERDGTVVFTAKTTVASQGDFKIGADLEATLNNLKDCIANTGGTATANYSPYAYNTAGCRKALSMRLSATVASNVITLFTRGRVTKTASAGTLGTQIAICFFGQDGSIDFVAQKLPATKFVDAPDKHGVNVMTWDLYGTKFFRKGRQRSVKLEIAVG